MASELISNRIVIDDSYEAIQDYLYREGRTDGLPVAPPTEDRVRRMLASMKLAPGDLIGTIPPAHGQATAEKVAINAVMAGCLPAYFPVVVACIRAMLEPEFVVARVQATTNPVAPLFVLNGPIREELEINCANGALGPGRRSNATIGRAVRLAMINIGGATPGVSDMSTLGSSSKYTCCIGENEEASPWEPLHVDRGFAKDDSTVTVFGAVCFRNILELESKTASGMLITLAGSMTGLGDYGMCFLPGEPLLILSPEHASIFSRDGLSKADVRDALWERACLPVSAYAPEQLPAVVDKMKVTVIDGKIHISRKPEDLIIVVAGGIGPHSQFVQNYSSKPATMRITES
ncbi:MAG: hypothetical protein HYX92_18790 [Chloroflexi bacterium]|nr:hypothetical protein [Chloroflexota bacterium]